MFVRRDIWRVFASIRTVAVGAGALIFSISVIAIKARGAEPNYRDDGVGKPKFSVGPSVTNFSANATTIPYFRSQFTDPTNGHTYAYTMVGTDPAKGDRTTTIPVVIIPFRLTFTASVDPNFKTLDGSAKVVDTLNSPVFQDSNVGAAADATASAPPPLNAGRVVNEPDDITQLGDAIYRAQWGKVGSDFHLRLGEPDVLATQSFTVPSNLGVIVVGRSSHAHIGLLDDHWFTNRLYATIQNLHIEPGTLPIILLYNTFLYTGHDLNNCCVLGFHGATTSLQGNGRQQVQTFMFASYSDQGIFAANPGDRESFIADIHALSHEVQEWYDDPFVNNVVNPWLTPTAPQYGCTTILETGDPVVGYGFKIALNGEVYHPEDEVHFSWFARENPSRAEVQYYTYLNNFPTVAQGCQ
jgi:hypothetical protein